MQRFKSFLREHASFQVLLALALVASVLLATPASAQTPTCSSATSDSDGDGWGFENNQSCRVASSSTPTASDTCDYSAAEANDGWGYDNVNRQSCPPRNGGEASSQPASTCDYSAADVNNGWGYDNVNRQSCPPREGSTQPTPVTTPEPAPIVQLGACNYENGAFDSVYGYSGRFFRCEELLEPGAVISHDIFDDGSQTIVSEAPLGEVRVVNIDSDGQVEVGQIREDAGGGISLTDWHFENRDELNRDVPTTLDEAVEEGWQRLPHGQADFHQDPNVHGNEIKFIHPDGREAIYYQSGRLVTDPAIAGTFNYVNPRAFPDDLNIVDWVAFGAYGAAHMLVDWVPWVFGGSVRGGGFGQEPLGMAPPISTYLDNLDDDDDGIPAGDDLDDKDPNRGARPGSPSAINEEFTGDPSNDGGEFGFPDADGDGVPDDQDDYPNDRTRHTRPSGGNTGNGGSDGGGGGGSVQTSGGSLQTSSGGTVSTGGG